MSIILSLTMVFSEYSAATAVPAPELAQATFEVAAKHGLNPYLLARVMLVESRGRPHAYNARTDDWGLMQINRRSHPHVNKKCLTEWRCNLEVGAAILARARRPCNYNLGAKSLIGTRMQKCLKYEHKLATVF